MKKIIYFGFLLMSAGLVAQPLRLKHFERPLTAIQSIILYRGSILHGSSAILSVIGLAQLGASISIGDYPLYTTGCQTVLEAAGLCGFGNWANDTNDKIAANWNTPPKFTHPDDQQGVNEYTAYTNSANPRSVWQNCNLLQKICVKDVKEMYSLNQFLNRNRQDGN